MTHQGGCHCGAVRYEVAGEPQHVALCHCSDCRKSSGAPMVAWAAFAEEQFKLVEGEPVTFNSSGAAMRSFCPKCENYQYDQCQSDENSLADFADRLADED